MSASKECSSTEIFPASVLQELQLSSSPASDLCLRPLCLEDYDRGYLTLLSQLTSVGDITREEWEARWVQMRDCGSTYYVLVLEDRALGQVVGAATLVLERKFIHRCGSVGRLEDVVVSDKYRGRQLGKLLVNTASSLAVKLGCYKVTLNCTDKMIGYYSSLGFRSEEGNSNFMCLRTEVSK